MNDNWEHPEPGWYCRTDGKGSVVFDRPGHWECIAYLAPRDGDVITPHRHLPDSRTAHAGMTAVDEFIKSRADRP